MKFLVFMVAAFIGGNVFAVEINDPMKPPAYALMKYRQEKWKSSKAVKKPVAAQKKAEPWVLSSILYARDRQHAIINNQLVKKGEIVRGAKLIGLKPGSARLLLKGKVIDLKLRKPHKAIKKSRVERKI